jgi:HSP20 family protein
MSIFNLTRDKQDKPQATASHTPATRVREVELPVDIYEGPEELLLLADLPGVEPDGLSVHFDASELRIEGRRGLGDTSLVYTRAFRVSERIDANGISAELNSGVLKLKLPKSPETRPRKIEVRTG